jgi:GNAT superfamily N-acetyltransferase
MKLRQANWQDAKAISALIHRVAHYFTINPDGTGAEDFFKTISPDAIERYINDSGFIYLVGLTDGHLTGVVSIRDNKHLFHLFISPNFQRLGHARELWEAAKTIVMQQGNAGEFTVNSTPFAAPVYAKLGFEAIGPKVETKGIAFIPMKLTQRA